MEFSELRKLIDDGLEFEDIEIKVENYLPLTNKLMLINGMENEKDEHLNGLVDNIIEKENSIYSINRFKYEMYFTFEVIRWFTDITFENTEFNIDDYDYSMKNGIFNKIVSTIGHDYYKFKQLLDLEIEKVLKEKNSLEGILNNGIKMLINKIPDEKGMKSVLNKLGKIDPEKMSFLTDVLKLNNPSSSPIPPKIKKSKKASGKNA